MFVKGGSGGTPKSSEKRFYDGNIPFLSITDISKSSGEIFKTEKHISDEGLLSSSAWIVPKESISLAMYASVGKVAILKDNIATSQAFYNMTFKDKNIRNIVFQMLLNLNLNGGWNRLISTGTQANLNADKVKNFKFYISNNIDECEKISKILKNIDQLITANERSHFFN